MQSHAVGFDGAWLEFALYREQSVAVSAQRGWILRYIDSRLVSTERDWIVRYIDSRLVSAEDCVGLVLIRAESCFRRGFDWFNFRQNRRLLSARSDNEK